MFFSDIERPDTEIHKFDAHSDIINTLDAIGGGSASRGAKEIVTGSRDGSVKVWDPRQKDFPVAHISAKTTEGLTDKRDCWAVAFGDSFNSAERAVCSGYDNGDIKLFDLRKMSLRWETNCGNGICSVEFDRKDTRMNKLAVATLEGGLYTYNMQLEDPTKGLTKRNIEKSFSTSSKSTVWIVKHLPQSRNVFITGDGSGIVQTWSHNLPNKRSVELSETDELQMLSSSTLSRKPIHCIDWCPERLGLAVCGALDQTIRILITTNLNLY